MRRLGSRAGAFIPLFLIQNQRDKGILLVRLVLDAIQMLPEV